MCIPNNLVTNRFNNLTCPDDGMAHFTIDFVQGHKTKGFIVRNKPVSEKAYEANVHFTYDKFGNVKSIDVCLIAPMPDEDASEFILYEVTELGKEVLKHGDNKALPPYGSYKLVVR